MNLLRKYFRPLDTLAMFETACSGQQAVAPARYAIRQALDQEHQKYLIRQRADARQARYNAGGNLESDGQSQGLGRERISEEKPKLAAVKRDFFGRIIAKVRPESEDGNVEGSVEQVADCKAENEKVWVSFHEGFSNAVRKPITLEDLMRGF